MKLCYTLKCEPSVNTVESLASRPGRFNPENDFRVTNKFEFEDKPELFRTL